MENKRNTIFRWWFGLAWLQFVIAIALITYFSLAPDPGDAFESFSDKTLHVFGWFVMLCSLHVALRKRTVPWYFAVLLLTYSGLIEIMQGMMPPREMDAKDLLANGAGIVIGLLIVYLMAPLYQRWLLDPLRRLSRIE